MVFGMEDGAQGFVFPVLLHKATGLFAIQRFVPPFIEYMFGLLRSLAFRLVIGGCLQPKAFPSEKLLCGSSHAQE